MDSVRRRLSYANVVATLALFLALGGGAVWAAGKIGSKGLKANAVTAGKIKRNAVTNSKIRGNSVTTPKLKNGAVNFAKLAPGTNLIAAGSGGPVSADTVAPITVPLSGGISFAPAAGAAAFLSVEARANDLARVGAEPCEPRIVPFVNGSEWGGPERELSLRAFAPTAKEPTGLSPVTGETGPIGLASPGVTQTVSVKVLGDLDCTPNSTVSVAIAVTQAK